MFRIQAEGMGLKDNHLPEKLGDPRKRREGRGSHLY